MGYLDYQSLIRARPDLFQNPPGAPIRILADAEGVFAAEHAARERLEQAGLPVDWAETGILMRDQYVMVLRDAVKFIDESLGTYLRVVPPAPAGTGVAILPVLDGRVLVVRHFRHSTRNWHWEIPRGYGEAGATPAEDARRELWEEVQGTVKRIAELGRIYPDTGLSSECVELLYAELKSFGKRAKVEGIERVKLLEIGEFERWLRNGTITDGFSIAAYAKARVLGLV